MAMMNTLIDHYQTYLHLQYRLSKAIENRDESLLDQLRKVSADLFVNIEVHRKALVDTSDVEGVRDASFLKKSSQLVLLMKQAQRQVQDNEASLQSWLLQMKEDIYRYRSSQSPRGVLATYLQQKQGASPRIIPSADISDASTQDKAVTAGIPAQSPWMSSMSEPETVGHRFNQQS